ncbi:hypothetical protein C922_03727 [Plasmodium inui San Antonio 1]|uniref:Uncharacterized protein n=1 Tax=Plasmodium inui San Antonio 1 TaxID=1237626 RepID=W7A2V5_9APIC|nr:hypothetical protein C922_03727 [Plasmodium inui San Antonio 1]EUD66000.1 hypothetical protein C922_03727 [Plasmodium inui San Antonio 1]
MRLTPPRLRRQTTSRKKRERKRTRRKGDPQGQHIMGKSGRTKLTAEQNSQKIPDRIETGT